MMPKKAQLQIFETIIVIFIFFILFISGFVFYVNFIKGSTQNSISEFAGKKSVQIVDTLMVFPEIFCSEDNKIDEHCIDLIKLESAKKIMGDNSLFYHDLLEFSNVTVTRIYPDSGRWELYIRKPPAYKDKFVTEVPVSLKDPATKKQGFGVLTIETYVR